MNIFNAYLQIFFPEKKSAKLAAYHSQDVNIPQQPTSFLAPFVATQRQHIETPGDVPHNVSTSLDLAVQSTSVPFGSLAAHPTKLSPELFVQNEQPPPRRARQQQEQGQPEQEQEEQQQNKQEPQDQKNQPQKQQ